MNYFAHGIRYLDRPHFLVGSAVPDLLSVANRKCRVRRRIIETQLPQLHNEEHELALGVLQHLHDDQWFHGTRGFYEVTGTMGRAFRDALGPDESWHCGFLGHIVVELLIDSTFIEDHPDALREYYVAFEEIDAQQVQQTVGLLATQPPQELSRILKLFVKERFLADYPDNERLLHRLNQVMKRVAVRPLPREILPVLQWGRDLVRGHLSELLPEEHFTAPEIRVSQHDSNSIPQQSSC